MTALLRATGNSHSLAPAGDCTGGGLGYAEVLLHRSLRRAGSAMHDESPLVRQWILLRTLASRKYGATVKELAGEAGVSIKTIRRDLETFQTAGFPLREVVGDFGRKTWRLESARPPAELHFTWDEAAALYLGRRLLEPLMGTVFWQAARAALCDELLDVLRPLRIGLIGCSFGQGSRSHDPGHGGRTLGTSGKTRR